jgi:signal peptidase II
MAFSRTTWWRRMLPWLALALLVIFLDQLTKIVIERSFSFGDVHPVTGFFNLVLTYNKGAAFSFLASASGWQDEFLTFVGIGASLFIVYLLARHGTQKLFSLALALILGGAIGNVIDRVRLGYVVDFIHAHWGSSYFPAFNIADSAITIGAALLIFDAFREKRPA